MPRDFRTLSPASEALHTVRGLGFRAEGHRITCLPGLQKAHRPYSAQVRLEGSFLSQSHLVGFVSLRAQALGF